MSRPHRPNPLPHHAPAGWLVPDSVTVDYSAIPPEAVYAYLGSTGWAWDCVAALGAEPRKSWRVYTRASAVRLGGPLGGVWTVEVPRWQHYADYGRRLREALAIVAEAERRPAPDAQVARAIHELAQGGEHDVTWSLDRHEVPA